jgi:tetratricopeptide (TPR) repeat protein
MPRSLSRYILAIGLGWGFLSAAGAASIKADDRLNSQAEIGKGFEILDARVEIKAVFPPWATGKLINPEKPWRPEEREALVVYLRHIEKSAPTLVAPQAAGRPLRFHRIANGLNGYNLIDHSICLNDEWASLAVGLDFSPMAAHILAHELSHAIDSWKRISWSKGWVALARSRLERVRSEFAKRTGAPSVEWPIPREYEKDVSYLRELADREGLPTDYAATNLAEALAEFTARIATDPKYSPSPEIRKFIQVNVLASPSPEDSISGMGHRALAAVEKGEVAGAIQELDSAIRKDPDRPLSYYVRGMCLRSQKDYERTIADFNRAIDLSPELHEDLLRARAETYGLFMPKPEVEKAVADLDRILAAKPHDWEIYAERGIFWLNAGRPHLALPDCDKALQLNPGATVAKLNRINAVRMLLGQLQDKDGSVRSTAARGLAAAGNAAAENTRIAEQVLSALKAAAQDTDPNVRQAASDSLKNIEAVMVRTPERK